MGNNLLKILLEGVVPGIVASAIYAFFMWVLSPRVRISPFMCFFTENDKVVHRIKVINRSHARLINKIEEVKQLEESYIHADFDKFSRQNTDYAIRIKYVIDTNKYKLDEKSFFQFKITVTRSYSNRIKCFKQNFYTTNIKHGQHEKGKNLGFIAAIH